jgi:uncharacterized glyoxalase superfamily metalloenzyme YdcJ
MPVFRPVRTAFLAAAPFSAFTELTAIAVTFAAFATRLLAALIALTGFTPLTLAASLAFALLAPAFVVDLHDAI